uniref:Glomulin, FKBP associated protein b n=1 Tax=Oryzias latipes TaxID=8090 RepID=A0A3B3HB76_ORYLA
VNESNTASLSCIQRDSQEEDLTPEDYQQFKTLGSACLTEGASEQLLKFVQEEKNQVLLGDTCSPNKLLQNMLEMIEDIDPGAISETIVVLLPHLQTVVLRLEDRRAACLGLSLSALHGQLSRLPVPYTLQQEEEDECGLCGCCAALALFLRPFVDELTSKDGKEEAAAEDEELKVELLKLYVYVERFFLSTCPSKILILSLNGSVTDSSLYRDSRACLAYLVFVELLTVESFPAVFSPLYLLQCNMEHIDHLLTRYESHLRKGLALMENSLKKVEDNSLPVGLMELRSFYGGPQNLRLILTDCPMRHLRESGLQLFQIFIDKLDTEAKHKFFRCMLKTSNHEGVESYVIKNIRRQIAFSMKGNPNKYFLGLDLLPLLALVFILPHGAETNLLTNMDKIMEGLNLLRYVFLKAICCLVWITIKEEYLKMLRVALSMSRAYYSSELKALKEGQKLKARAELTGCLVSQVLESALVTFDLMDSLTVRIEEITEETLS